MREKELYSVRCLCAVQSAPVAYRIDCTAEVVMMESFIRQVEPSHGLSLIGDGACTHRDYIPYS